ncbi:BNR repeat-like domain-containing protein [Pedobacter africanus]|uniref:exo-alpha-sialidase n=2 Tax=Pedobacter africanus TaxID=151894 RepID=A0A1W2DLA1_9SPHI|nr:BNR repeat-like domain-containing protein [Pedobacter africanus]
MGIIMNQTEAIQMVNYIQMKTYRPAAYFFFTLWIGLLLTGCYKEEHFDFPGPYEEANTVNPDSLPFPFDKSRQAGMWLVKNGVPDYGKVLFKGYTDYYPKGDTLSWVKASDGLHMLPHFSFYPLSNADHFAGDPNSYKFNWVYSKYFVPVGSGKSFYMYAKVTFGTFNSTAAGLSLGKNWDTGGPFTFGLDGNTSTGEPGFFLDLYGKNGITVNPALGWPTVTQVMTPGVPADMEVVIANGIFYVKVNGTLVFTFKMAAERAYFYTPQIRPWRNFVAVHDMYIESREMYTLDYAMHEYEGNYNKIQAPALAKAANGDLLLFAEGRGTPASSKERVAQNTMPVGNTDIIMKRSSDGGTTWSSQIQVLAGAGSNATYCFPQVLTADNGKIILQYSSIGGSFTTNTYNYDASSQRVFQIESVDNGNSWSAPVELTVFKNTAAGYIMGGAGHGIALKSVNYNKRLVMPLTYSTNVVRVALSDDGGSSWRLSKVVGGSRLKQGTVAELADGRLMMVVGHTNTSPKNKLVSYSSDGGENWTAAANIASDVKTGDYGHLFAGIVLKSRDGELLFVNPTNRESDAEVKNSPTYAVAAQVFKSGNNGQAYSNLGPLFTREAYFGYNAPIGLMDGVVTDDGKLVIAAEGGVESPAEGIVIYKK